MVTVRYDAAYQATYLFYPKPDTDQMAPIYANMQLGEQNSWMEVACPKLLARTQALNHNLPITSPEPQPRNQISRATIWNVTPEWHQIESFNYLIILINIIDPLYKARNDTHCWLACQGQSSHLHPSLQSFRSLWSPEMRERHRHLTNKSITKIRRDSQDPISKPTYQFKNNICYEYYYPVNIVIWEIIMNYKKC